jgi:restriction system protein
VAKRRGVITRVADQQQAYQRQLAQNQRAYATAVRARELAEKAAQRAAASDARERAKMYVAARSDEVDALNAEVESEMYDLTSILSTTLERDHRVNIEALKETFGVPAFQPGWLDVPVAAPDRAAYLVPPISLAQKLMPGGKEAYERQRLDGEQRYAAAFQQWHQADMSRHQQLRDYRKVFEDYVAAEQERVSLHNAGLEQFFSAARSGNKEAVVDYVSMVLQGSLWPDGFPQEFTVVYDDAAKLLGVDLVLPGLDIVPEIKSYKYVKAGDKVTSTNHSMPVRRNLYADVLAASALRILHEIFEGERFSHIRDVALNCLVRTISPATGQMVQPCLLSVRTTRDAFASINLAAVKPQACLKALAAVVSAAPAELTAVRPFGRASGDRLPLHRGARRAGNARQPNEPDGPHTRRV